MGMFMVDPFTMLYQLLILIAALACCTLSHAYIESYKDNREELYSVIVFCCWCNVDGGKLSLCIVLH
jgi:NADH-quinone oxidoreductase subunit N